MSFVIDSSFEPVVSGLEFIAVFLVVGLVYSAIEVMIAHGAGARVAWRFWAGITAAVWISLAAFLYSFATDNAITPTSWVTTFFIPLILAAVPTAVSTAVIVRQAAPEIGLSRYQRVGYGWLSFVLGLPLAWIVGTAAVYGMIWLS